GRGPGAAAGPPARAASRGGRLPGKRICPAGPLSATAARRVPGLLPADRTRRGTGPPSTRPQNDPPPPTALTREGPHDPTRPRRRPHNPPLHPGRLRRAAGGPPVGLRDDARGRRRPLGG